MTTPDLPALDDLGPDDLDFTRLPTIVAATLAHAPDDLYGRWQRGEMRGTSASPIDPETGMLTVYVDLPGAEFPVHIAEIHYGMLWRGRPFGLVNNPPTITPGV